MFWDPKAPAHTRKLDAIDTDQITPATDCVSESLETLDERWKAGSFQLIGSLSAWCRSLAIATPKVSASDMVMAAVAATASMRREKVPAFAV